MNHYWYNALVYQFLDGYDHSALISHEDMHDSKEGQFIFIGADGVLNTEFGSKFGGSISMGFSLEVKEKFF